MTAVTGGRCAGLYPGVTGPSAEMARHLDQTLGADGALTTMVTETVSDPEGCDRIGYAIVRPARLDAATVDALAAVLAAQRRLDDTMAARVMLPWAEPQWQTVQQLARDARGPHTSALHTVVAEWTQFLGWLHAEARDDARAVQLLSEAAHEADTVADGVLAAQVENFRGYVERQRGNPRDRPPLPDCLPHPWCVDIAADRRRGAGRSWAGSPRRHGRGTSASR